MSASAGAQVRWWRTDADMRVDGLEVPVWRYRRRSGGRTRDAARDTLGMVGADAVDPLAARCSVGRADGVQVCVEAQGLLTRTHGERRWRR